MLRNYPEYGKVSDEYFAAIVELLASYPRYLQNRLADAKEGVPSRCKFLPTAADVVGLADAIEDRQRHRDELNRRYAREKPIDELPPIPQVNPFPKLVEAFADERGLLLKGQRFDVLFDASRALAVSGIDRARSILSRTARSVG